MREIDDAKTVEDICREYRAKMQRMVNRKGAGVSKITMTVGDGKEVVIAERRQKEKRCDQR